MFLKNGAQRPMKTLRREKSLRANQIKAESVNASRRPVNPCLFNLFFVIFIFLVCFLPFTSCLVHSTHSFVVGYIFLKCLLLICTFSYKMSKSMRFGLTDWRTRKQGFTGLRLAFTDSPFDGLHCVLLDVELHFWTTWRHNSVCLLSFTSCLVHFTHSFVVGYTFWRVFNHIVAFKQWFEKVDALLTDKRTWNKGSLAYGWRSQTQPLLVGTACRFESKSGFSSRRIQSF